MLIPILCAVGGVIIGVVGTVLVIMFAFRNWSPFR